MADRFDPPRDHDWKPLPMRPDIAGQYVRYSDLAEIAEIERLTKERDAACTAPDFLQGQFNVAYARAEKAEAERDEARAQVAAAFEAAARRTESGDVEYPSGTIDMEGEELREILRALTPADAKAALEAYGREKVREGMRRAADLFKDANHGEHIMSAILAAMEKEGGE